MKYDADVVVLGGGPAGLAASMATARRGMRVIVADGAVPPIDKACGEGLMPDSLDAAARLGFKVPAAAGHPFRGIRFLDGAASVASLFPRGTGVGVRRTVLHQAMIERAAAAGVQLRYSSSFTGLAGHEVRLGSHSLRARWIIGADGSQSSVRRWAGLESTRRETRRFGFRLHFRVAPWSEFMEIHWGDGCQFYVTPVASDEICLVLMSRDPHLRVREALAQFPELARCFPESLAATVERGSPAGTRLLRRVSRGQVALLGDASGTVDAITGEGLSMAFQQAEALASAIEHGNLESYEQAHRRMMRRPVRMGDLMLALDRLPQLRRRAIPVLAARPDLFETLLAMHVGEVPFAKMATAAAAVCWGAIVP